MSGVLRPPDRPLATSSMATNVTVMMLMAWIGILVAVSVKVGWLVGAGDVEGAKTAGLAGAAAAAVMGCAAAVVIFLARDYIIAFFTVDEGLQQMGAALLQVAFATRAPSCPLSSPRMPHHFPAHSPSHRILPPSPLSSLLSFPHPRPFDLRNPAVSPLSACPPAPPRKDECF